MKTETTRYRTRSHASITGFVLAGGASTRMGRPKDQLVVGGETMLARQVRLLGRVARRIEVLGARKASPANGASAHVWRLDDVPACGPLGGIYTGLRHARTEFNLFLSCDLPFMESDFLGYLVRRAVNSGADATVPKSSEGRLNPLCAVYRRRALQAIQETLASGNYAVRSFFPQVHCLIIPWREFSLAGFSADVLVNMNTPAEYARVTRKLGSMDQVEGRRSSI